MLRFPSVSRHLIYQYRYIPQEGNICPINQNYGPPGPSLLWYRHFFPTSVIPSQFPRSLRNNFQKRAKVSQAEPQYVWRTVTHSREGGGGADEERDKSKLHLCGWVLMLSSRMGLYRDRDREAPEAQRKIQHVTAQHAAICARAFWLDRFNNATHVCKLWSRSQMYRLTVDRMEYGLTVASHHIMCHFVILLPFLVRPS